MERNKINIYSDFKFIIDRLLSRLKYKRTVDQYILPDIDLELEIISRIQSLRNTYEVQILYADGLSFIDNHHTIADNLCKISRTQPSIKLYNKIPTNKVDFSINDRIINHHIGAAAIRSYRSIDEHF